MIEICKEILREIIFMLEGSITVYAILSWMNTVHMQYKSYQVAVSHMVKNSSP